MQAYAQYLPDKMKREMCVSMCCGCAVCAGVFCCRTAAISAPFTPLSTFRFQPLPAVAFLAIDVDITFHYVTSQFSAFSSALANSALLGIGKLGVARHWQTRRCSALANSALLGVPW